jgi:hypothetical protein
MIRPTTIGSLPPDGSPEFKRALDGGEAVMLDYLTQVSIFESMLALVLLLALDWSFTLIHILQEWKGEKVPLWRVFGAIVGLFIPNGSGFVWFTLVLCAVQWLLGLVAIAGWLPVLGPLNQPYYGVMALGGVLGARVADSVVSHWMLYRLGYRPNPGLSSTVLYCAEVIFILVAFRAGLSSYPIAAGIGFAGGAIVFIGVLPLLRLIRMVKPSGRRDPWVRGEPIPVWALK